MRIPAWTAAVVLLAGCASAPRGVEWYGGPAAVGDASEWTAVEPAPSISSGALERALYSLQQQGGYPEGPGSGYPQGYGNPPQGAPPQGPPPSGQAPGPKEPFRKGLYIGFGIVKSEGEIEFDNPDFALANIIPNVDNSSSVEGDGFSLRIGYRASPNVGLEGTFDWTSYDLTEDPPGFELDGTVDVVTIGFNARFYVPIDRVEPYVLLGFGLGSAAVDIDWNDDAETFFMSTSGSMTAFNFRFGLGVDVYTIKNLALNLEWAMTLGIGAEAGGASYAMTTGDLTFGLLFRF